MARELLIDIMVDNGAAIQKLRETDVAIEQVGTTAQTTSTHIDTGAQGFDTYTVSAKEAADVLSGNVTPGINDLAEACGITFTQLGILSSAGLAIGVGYAAWGIGRAIADFFDLDDKIAHATATLMGWGDVAAEAAGAKADVLAKATAAAGREITDFNEAMEINAKTVEDWNRTVARASAPEDARLQIVRWKNEIAELSSAGVLGAFTRNIQDNDLSIKFLSEHYGVSTGAIALYKKELKEADAAQKAWTDSLKGSTGATTAHNGELERLTEKLHAIENGGDHAYSTLHQWLGELQRDQKYLNQLSDEHMQKLIEEAGANDRFLQTELANALAIDKERDAWLGAAAAADKAREAADAAAHPNNSVSGLSKGGTFLSPTSESLDNVLGPARPDSTLRVDTAGSRMPISVQRRATGGGVDSDRPYWVGEQGPELFTPRSSGAISPTGAAGGGGGISITVMGNVNSEATARMLADQVAEKVMRKLRQTGRSTFSKS